MTRPTDLTRDLELAARLLVLWRLCRKSRCRRARCCCEPRRCCELLVDWSEALALKDKRVGFDDALRRLREAET